MEESRYFSFVELEKITEQFAEERELGRGGYGVVYKGIQDDGEVIAVKKLHSELQGINDAAFHNEILYLRNVDHPNVVRVIGFCHESRRQFFMREGKPIHAYGIERLLCFEYVEGGSLDTYISDELCNLDWPTCYRIIRGTCEGLNHLHAQGQPIYHRDLKPSNILLDRNMMPKIADLGLSKIVASTDTYKTESQLKGTPGYMPPEFAKGGHVSSTFDVFSLGVIIIRIMDGNEGNSRRFEMPRQQFINRVTKNWNERMQGTSRSSQEKNIQQVNMCVDIALSCVEDNRTRRPRVHDIVKKMKALDDEFGELSSKIGELSSKIHNPTLQSESACFERSATLPAAMDDPDSGSLPAAVEVSISPGSPLAVIPSRIVGIGEGEIQHLEMDLDELSSSIFNLKQELEGLRMPLVGLSKTEGHSITAKCWTKQVREICYDTRDYLYDFIHSGNEFKLLEARALDASERFFRYSIQAETLPISDSTTSVVNRLPAPHAELIDQVDMVDFIHSGNEFKLLEARALDASERFVRYSIQAETLPISDSTTSVVNRLPAPHAELIDQVDMVDEVTKLIANEKKLKVVSIVGPEGAGKTTLAKSIYRNIGESETPYLRAFLRASPNPDILRLLTSMFIQIKHKRPSCRLSAHDLIDSISSYLQNKRYFIIIDDLWTASVWETISRAFPDGDCGSRIITTTQSKGVALACSGYQSKYVFKMEALSDAQSENVFFRTAFGSEGGCPSDLIEVSRGIIRKCGGLPLATINIASMLSSAPNIQELAGICNSLPYTLRTNPTPEWMKEVVNLIYSALKPHLKTCLLYFSMYPEGYILTKTDLVKQWVVEGFLDGVEGKTTEEVAGGYFDELVRRGLIQPVNTNKNGKVVLSCTLHHTVHDFIVNKSMEENFIITVDYFQSGIPLADKVRRLSVQFGDASSAHIPESIMASEVRSLAFFGFFRCFLSVSMDKYRHLRVLILHIWADEDKDSFDLTGIRELLRLRYLKIACNISVKLPDKIRGQQCLERLEVSTVTAIPWDFGELSELRILKIAVTKLTTKDIYSLQILPALSALSLHVKTAPSKLFVFRKGGFSVLKFFTFRCSAPRLVIKENAMPIIEKVNLCFKVHEAHPDGKKPITIRHLPSIQEISAKIWGTVADAGSALADAVINHARNPIPIVQLMESRENQEHGALEEQDEIMDESRDDLSGKDKHSEADTREIVRHRKNHMENKSRPTRWAPVDFTFRLLEEITDGFSEKQKIGIGAYGVVYKGVHNGEEIAVKKLVYMMEPDNDQFRKEINILMMVHHQNIVALVGYCHQVRYTLVEHHGKYICAEIVERALCFEYLEGGSLDKHISDASSGLDWSTRYKIIKGICDGLNYLHNGSKDPIYHLNLSLANILLDKNMTPKIGGFGLSTVCASSTSFTTHELRGTIGYMPPECINKLQISNKFDVFSLGVIINKIMAGPESNSKCAGMTVEEFVELVHGNWGKRLQSMSWQTSQEVKTCIEIAFRSVEADPAKRPTISEIVDELKKLDTQGIDPLELRFPFKLHKEASCVL